MITYYINYINILNKV